MLARRRFFRLILSRLTYWHMPIAYLFSTIDDMATVEIIADPPTVVSTFYAWA